MYKKIVVMEYEYHMFSHNYHYTIDYSYPHHMLYGDILNFLTYYTITTLWYPYIWY